MARRIKIDRTKLKEPDEFISTSQRVYQWVAERRQPILYAVLVVAVLIAATRGVQAYKRNTALKAQNLLYQAMKVQFAPLGASPTPNAALDRYTDLLRRYPRASVAPFAKLQVGNILFAQGRYAEAAAKFTEVLRVLPPSHPLKDLTLLSLAHCYHDSGNLPEAIATAHKVVDDPNSMVRDYAAHSLVTWERERGEPAKAEEALVFLQENFPESPLIQRLIDTGAVPTSE